LENKAALEQRVAERSRQAEVLYQNAIAISSQLELSVLLPAIVKRAAELLGTRFGGLYLLEPDPPLLRLVVTHNIPGEYVGSTLALGEGLSGRVAVSGEPLMVEDHRTWEGHSQTFRNGPFTRVLAVPLKTRQGILGVLNFSDDQRTGIFSEDELHLATLFAEQAALAIENARLYETAQRELEERRRAEQELRRSEERFKHISGSISDFAFSCVKTDSQSFAIDWLTGEVEKITGYTSDELKGLHCWGNLVIEQDKPIFEENLLHLQPGQSGICELRIRRKDGELRWLMVFSECVEDKEPGVISRLYGGIHDITLRRQIEEDFHRRQHYLEHLNAITQAALQINEFNQLLQLLADRMGQMMGADGCYITLWDAKAQRVVPAAAYGPMREDYPQIKPDPKDQSLTVSVLKERRAIAVEDVFNSPFISPNIAGLFPSKSLLGLPLIANQELLGAALISYDQPHLFSPIEISLGEQAAGQIALAIYKTRLLTDLQRLAIVDELTGVYNFRGLGVLGRREFERARRFNRSLAALFVDLDHFRSFNNRYSHTVGNLVLQAVVDQAQRCVRSVDLVARFGGEEFVILLPETDLAEACKVAERLRGNVETCEVDSNFGLLSVTISLGVAELTPDMPDLVALIDAANQAEHQAKEQGRNRMVAFHASRKETKTINHPPKGET
jgi:diguanylate cyclase (GGDEF)-like protein/PAS domain S-box-containing protein